METLRLMRHAACLSRHLWLQSVPCSGPGSRWRSDFRWPCLQAAPFSTGHSPSQGPASTAAALWQQQPQPASPLLSLLAAARGRGHQRHPPFPAHRQLHCSVAPCAAPTSAAPWQPCIVELRELELAPCAYLNVLDPQAPAGLAEFLAQPPSSLGCFSVETGGVTNRILQLLAYDDYDHKDSVQRSLMRHQGWRRQYRELYKPVQRQTSKMLVQASALHQQLGMTSLLNYQQDPTARPNDADPVYELRTYQLRPGQGGAAKVLQALSSGLPSKMALDPTGTPVFIGHSDVGMLNQVVEVWRYPSKQELIRSCELSRKASQWGEAKAAIYSLCHSFETSFLRPLPGSAWQ